MKILLQLAAWTEPLVVPLVSTRAWGCLHALVVERVPATHGRIRFWARVSYLSTKIFG
jgi:hypothetical protein